MSELNLNFLDDQYAKNEITYVDLLDKYGKEITEYGKGYFTSITTTTKVDDEVTDVSLYILAPELPYEYRILNIHISSINSVKLAVFSIIENPISIGIIITDGIATVEEKIKEYLGTNHVNDSLRLLVHKINLKRKSIEE